MNWQFLIQVELYAVFMKSRPLGGSKDLSNKNFEIKIN